MARVREGYFYSTPLRDLTTDKRVFLTSALKSFYSVFVNNAMFVDFILLLNNDDDDDEEEVNNQREFVSAFSFNFLIYDMKYRITRY